VSGNDLRACDGGQRDWLLNCNFREVSKRWAIQQMLVAGGRKKRRMEKELARGRRRGIEKQGERGEGKKRGGVQASCGPHPQ
jgi:hypothetical protein